ncbi:MAG TPA: hypothetical protein VEJ41_03715 [Candidatus Acidoferrales bacterium]|nr:hypothetical protein [Candidatus Acidoferrales bacterium]
MPDRRRRLVAAVSAGTLFLALAHPASAAPLHPTVTLRAEYVGFYAGHLVLDGIGNATFDDGQLHVQADRIIVDLRANRYVAAGSVTVSGVNVAHGDALGVDLTTHRGILVDAAGQPQTQLVAGGMIGGPTVIGQGQEPLALPDIGFELPYLRGTQAVAHLGADVRMANAHIIVPGGESIGLPSYVYTFSTDPGYSASNVPTNGEDLPIYYGSTPNSIQGIHFSYNSVTKVAIGLNSNFIFGNRGYILMAAGPIFGPSKAFNFEWLDHINDHTSQTFTSTTQTGVGTDNGYDLRDSVHRSYFELTAAQGLGAHSATFAWQSFNQTFGNWPGSRPYFWLRSEYGYTHVPEQFSFPPFPIGAVLPTTVWHNAFEAYLGTQTWNFGPNVSLLGSADWRDETDSLPHRQVSQTYTLTLYTRWTRHISTNYSDSLAPSVFDDYPSEHTIYHAVLTQQSLNFTYDNRDPFRLALNLSRATESGNNPSPPFAYPWTLSGDVRFRVTPSLSLDLSREYFFGFDGQRFGVLGLQLLP